MTKIFYFSGTGNSKWAANVLASKIEGETDDKYAEGARIYGSRNYRSDITSKLYYQ